MLSVSFCTRRNWGNTTTSRNSIIPTINTTAAAVIADHCQWVEVILAIAHTARMGALMTTCRPMEMIICTCMMSLVVRVMREAVEKRLISCMEKLSTLPNTDARRRYETAAPMRAAKKPTATELKALPSAQASMRPPSFHTSAMSGVPPVMARVMRDM